MDKWVKKNFHMKFYPVIPTLLVVDLLSVGLLLLVEVVTLVVLDGVAKSVRHQSHGLTATTATAAASPAATAGLSSVVTAATAAAATTAASAALASRPAVLGLLKLDNISTAVVLPADTTFTVFGCKMQL